MSAEEMKASTTACPFCDCPMQSTPQGELCLACLVGGGIDHDGELLGGVYEPLGILAEGGTGIVLQARRIEDDSLVAVKIAKPEVAASADGVAAFRAGVAIQRSLVHPNIVRVEETGTHEGRPFAAMQLLDGGTLGDLHNHERFRQPELAVSLVLTIARAVQFAHERGVLHCDLKPENVLLDAKGEPYVSDFGLARCVAGSAMPRRATFQGGSPGWMPPEQERGEDLSTRSDVFSLGAILYWLLTGDAPFGLGSEFAHRLQNDPLVPPRRLVGTLPSDLDLICCRALSKVPEQRYRSAAELADDLDRQRAGQPINDERTDYGRRFVKWARREKLLAGLIIQLALLLLYLPFMPLSVLREVKQAIREQNAFAAVAQAGAVMNELRGFALRVEALAQAPELASLVGGPTPDGPAEFLRGYTGQLDGAFVFDREGRVRAGWPVLRPEIVRTSFAFRDYFRGQQRLARAKLRDVYVSRAFLSYTDDELALGFSTPLLDLEGRHAGAVIGTVKTRATFGAVQMNCPANRGCLTALLGLRDRDRPDQKLSNALRILASPGLAQGEEQLISAELGARICARFGCALQRDDQFALRAGVAPLVIDDYVDPVSRARAIAAFAPVGGTGLVVLVATPDDVVDALTQRMSDRAKAFVWIPVLTGLLLLGSLLVEPHKLRAPWKPPKPARSRIRTGRTPST